MTEEQSLTENEEPVQAAVAPEEEPVAVTEEAPVEAAVESEDEAETNIIVRRSLKIDLDNSSVTIKNELIDLEPLEFLILTALVNNTGAVCTLYQIAEAITDEDEPVAARHIEPKIKSMKEKFGTSSRCIQNVIGIGYRFAL